VSRVEVSGSNVTRVLLRVVYRGPTDRLGSRYVVDGGTLRGTRARITVPYDHAANHVDRILGAVDAWAQRHGALALEADGKRGEVGRVRAGVLTGTRSDATYLLAEVEQRILE